ncbi:unnamed protein product [Chironomus riparius]|uniref:F-box domain-containing protein n=1 Tax=Chironomus riparius TaxID=315576 RepID=A0A9N9WMK2_9DIPT|nr:unnamed protein product [Chironomus riparius]
MDYINLLPNHVLTKIFGNLSPGMTKSCALVCKRWDEIIGTTSELMKRYQLNLEDIEEHEMKKAMKIQRKHQRVLADWSKSSLNVILRHKLQFLTFTEFEYTPVKLSTLVETLNNLPSLKYFDANLLTLKKSENCLNQVSTNIEQLKCAVEVIGIFACCTVRKLKIYSYRSRSFNKQMNYSIFNFLKTQKDLEELELIGKQFSELFILPDFIVLKFPLKVLKYSSCTPFTHYKEFIKFLNQHKRTLTSLEVDYSTEPQFGIELIHKFALENLINLKHFKIGHLRDNHQISYHELTDSTSITKNVESLAIKARSTDMNENKRFLNMFPNIKKLNFDKSENDEELLCCISEICVNIERLEVSSLDKDFNNPKILFPKLKELIINHDGGDISVFITRHSNTLEKISFKEFDYFPSSFSKSVLSCPNLNYLELNLGELSFASIVMIYSISSRSKPFKLVFTRTRPSFDSNFVTQHYTFNFPEDIAIFKDFWDENECD